MADIGIGTIRAAVEVDSKSADASLKGVAENFKQVGTAAEATGQKVDRAQKLQEAAIARQLNGMERWTLSIDKVAAAHKRMEGAQKLVTAVQQQETVNVERLTRALAVQAAAAENLARASATRSPEGIMSGVTQRQQASAIIRAGGGTLSVRAAESFATLLPGFEGFASIAFPIVGAAALTAELVKGVEAFRQMQEQAAKVKDAMEEFSIAADKVFGGYRESLLQAGIRTDELTGNHIAALRKQLELIDLQGFDRLEGSFKSLQSAADKTFTEIKSNWLSVMAQFSVTQAPGFKGTLDRFGREYSSLLAQGRGDEAQGRLNAVQQAEEQNRADLTAIRATGIRSWAHSGLVDEKTNSTMERLRSRGITDYSDETYNASTQVTETLEALQRAAGADRQLTASDRGNATGEAAQKALKSADKDAQELLKRYQKEFETLQSLAPMSEGQVASFWNRILPEFDESSPEFATVRTRVSSAAQRIHETLHASLKKLKEAEEKLPSEPAGKAGFTVSAGGTLGMFASGSEAMLKAQQSVKAMQASVNAEWQAAIDKVGLLTGRITPLQAAMDAQASHAEEYRLKLQALREQLQQFEAANAMESLLGSPEFEAKRLQIQTEIGKLQGQQRVAQLEDAQTTLSQTWTGMVDSVWDGLIRKANDAQHEMQQIAARFVDSMNSEFAKAVTGGHTNFSGVFRSASESLAKTGFEKLEGGLLKGFGLGSKPTGTASDPIHVVMSSFSGASSFADPASLASIFKAKTQSVLGPGGAALAPIGEIASKGLLGMLNDSNFLSGLFGGKLFGAGSFFGSLGHFAEGGPMPSNMPAIVGERGPEIFMPSTSGHIIPNHHLGQLGGGQTVMHIDARGTDPSLTRANFEQALRATYAQAVANSMHQMADRQQRLPR